jgi:hypothetical protein
LTLLIAFKSENTECLPANFGKLSCKKEKSRISGEIHEILENKPEYYQRKP